MGVLIAVNCPHCQNIEVIRHGKSSNGKPRFRCLSWGCPYLGVKQQVYNITVSFKIDRVPDLVRPALQAT
jgi:transposase-like protein